MTEKIPVCAIAYGITGSRVGIVFQFDNVNFGNLFIKGLKLSDYSAVYEIDRLKFNGDSSEQKNKDLYSDFLYQIKRFNHTVQDGGTHIFFVNLFCQETMKNALIEIKAIRNILDILNQERALSYLCWRVSSEIDSWLSQESLKQKDVDIELKLFRILKSVDFFDILSNIEIDATNPTYEKIKQAEGMILVYLRLVQKQEFKQRLNAALVELKSLSNDFINRVDTQCQSTNQKQSNVILAKE